MKHEIELDDSRHARSHIQGFHSHIYLFCIPTVIHDRVHDDSFGYLQGHHSNGTPNVSSDRATVGGTNHQATVFPTCVERFDEEHQEQPKLHMRVELYWWHGSVRARGRHFVCASLYWASICYEKGAQEAWSTTSVMHGTDGLRACCADDTISFKRSSFVWSSSQPHQLLHKTLYCCSPAYSTAQFDGRRLLYEQGYPHGPLPFHVLLAYTFILRSRQYAPWRRHLPRSSGQLFRP